MQMTSRTIRRLRRKVQLAINCAMTQPGGYAIVPPPNTGKTYGTLKCCSERDEPLTLVQPNKDLREEAERICEELGLTYLELPSFPDDSALCDKDSDWYDPRAKEWYDRGMLPRQIMEDELETPPAEDCDYVWKMEQDWTEYDVLIGDPIHVYLDRAVDDRHVVFDDTSLYGSFGNEYKIDVEEGVDVDIHEQVRAYLDQIDTDFDSLAEIRHCGDETRLHGLKVAMNETPAASVIPYTSDVTTDAQNIIELLLNLNDYSPNTEWHDPGDPCITGGVTHTGTFKDGTAAIFSVPNHVRHAESVIILGATPLPPVIEKFCEMLSLPLRMEEVLNEHDYRKYWEAMDVSVWQLTEFLRPYSSGRHIDEDRKDEILTRFVEKYGIEPVLFSTKKALENYEDLPDDHLNYARAIGTNQYADRRAAVLLGCPHFGDDYVKRVAAICGEDAEVHRDPGEEAEWVTPLASQIYAHMTEMRIFQAMMRVGREVDGPTYIWIDTGKVPDFVPRMRPTGKDALPNFSDSREDVFRSCQEDAKSIRELSDELDYSRVQIWRAVTDLTDRGYLEPAGATDYNAETFVAEAKDLLGELEADETVTSDLSDIDMAERNSFKRHTAKTRDLTGVVWSFRGIAPQPIRVEMDVMSLDLFT